LFFVVIKTMTNNGIKITTSERNRRINREKQWQEWDGTKNSTLRERLEWKTYEDQTSILRFWLSTTTSSCKPQRNIQYVFQDRHFVFISIEKNPQSAKCVGYYIYNK